MGLTGNGIKQRFDLRDLALFDGPPLKGAAIVTETATEVLQTTSAALITFDDVAAEAVLRTAARQLTSGTALPIYEVAVAKIRDAGSIFAVSDLASKIPQAAEHTKLGMSAMLAAAVKSPDDKTVGALTVLDAQPRDWTKEEWRKIENLAHLVTQEITLKASFLTLKIMAADLDPYRDIAAQSSEQ